MDTPLRLVLFDFDGTLCDSASLLERARENLNKFLNGNITARAIQDNNEDLYSKAINVADG